MQITLFGQNRGNVLPSWSTRIQTLSFRKECRVTVFRWQKYHTVAHFISGNSLTLKPGFHLALIFKLSCSCTSVIWSTVLWSSSIWRNLGLISMNGKPLQTLFPNSLTSKSNYWDLAFPLCIMMMFFQIPLPACRNNHLALHLEFPVQVSSHFSSCRFDYLCLDIRYALVLERNFLALISSKVVISLSMKVIEVSCSSSFAPPGEKWGNWVVKPRAIKTCDRFWL